MAKEPLAGGSPGARLLPPDTEENLQELSRPGMDDYLPLCCQRGSNTAMLRGPAINPMRWFKIITWPGRRKLYCEENGGLCRGWQAG